MWENVESGPNRADVELSLQISKRLAVVVPPSGSAVGGQANGPPKSLKNTPVRSTVSRSNLSTNTYGTANGLSLMAGSIAIRLSGPPLTSVTGQRSEGVLVIAYSFAEGLMLIDTSSRTSISTRCSTSTSLRNVLRNPSKGRVPLPFSHLRISATFKTSGSYSTGPVPRTDSGFHRGKRAAALFALQLRT
jgi:hypothetical protein